MRKSVKVRARLETHLFRGLRCDIHVRFVLDESARYVDFPISRSGAQGGPAPLRGDSEEQDNSSDRQ